MKVPIFDHVLAEDLGFTEGPLWTCRGTVMAVGLSRGLVYEIDPADGSRIRSVEIGGRPNGLAEGAEGDVWVAQAGHRGAPPSIQRIRGDDITTFAERFHAPNDLAFGPDGLLWFTDPAGHALGGAPQPGRIWAMDSESGIFTLKAEGVLYPNGLAFSPTGDALLVAETATARILRFDYAAGMLEGPTLFAQMDNGHPDGIAFDQEGNLYVASTDGRDVQIFSPHGELAEIIALPPQGFATNLCFGGADACTLYVTSAKGGMILSKPRSVPGLPLLKPQELPATVFHLPTQGLARLAASD
ncbi:SMP-30/gluconolactonase/LRE family protein [Flavisphingomonas formosensis]|uniref:SMP-30/gluconolactonase/LRE family protein n=1 Tax=Flavisphingomonas formosensis TaxID=861534 RepID=UPI0012F71FBD|nr:SMP-30/gluconolactonase/LRE family protein [Sphingomonas formosensis]